MKKAILLSILPLVASAFFMQSCTSLFNSNPYEQLVAGYYGKRTPIQDFPDQKEQTVLIAPDGRVVFESQQWMGSDSTAFFRTFQDRYIIAIPCPAFVLLFAQRGEYPDYRDFEYPRNIIYVIDVADDRVLYRTDLEDAVLVDISKGYAWGRDPDTGELRSSSLEVVSR